MMKISNFLQSGRSMVEMLGVLAIVGVLSVGGIAGYSKAMMKYKLNKFTVAMNELLNTCIQYTGQLNSDKNPSNDYGGQYFSKILYKMNALPDGIKYENNTSLIDMFGNVIWPYAYPAANPPVYAIGYYASSDGSNSLSNNLCHALINIAKDNSSQLKSIKVSNETSSATEDIGRLYGDLLCSANQKCLKNTTISDIDELCHYCKKNTHCAIRIVW